MELYFRASVEIPEVDEPPFIKYMMPFAVSEDDANIAACGSKCIYIYKNGKFFTRITWEHGAYVDRLHFVGSGDNRTLLVSFRRMNQLTEYYVNGKVKRTIRLFHECTDMVTDGEYIVLRPDPAVRKVHVLSYSKGRFLHQLSGAQLYEPKNFYLRDKRLYLTNGVTEQGRMDTFDVRTGRFIATLRSSFQDSNQTYSVFIGPYQLTRRCPTNIVELSSDDDGTQFVFKETVQIAASAHRAWVKQGNSICLLQTWAFSDRRAFVLVCV